MKPAVWIATDRQRCSCPPRRITANRQSKASPLAALSIRARATGRNDGDGQDGAGGAIRWPREAVIQYLELGVELGVEVPPAPTLWPRRSARRASRASLRALRRAVRRCTRAVRRAWRRSVPVCGVATVWGAPCPVVWVLDCPRGAAGAEDWPPAGCCVCASAVVSTAAGPATATAAAIPISDSACRREITSEMGLSRMSNSGSLPRA